MAHWKEHVRHCKIILGKGYDVVHRWLDEMSVKTFPSKYHRVYRHNEEGLQEIKEKWGEEGYKAGYIHILADEGEVMTKAQIKKHYDDMIKKNREK